MMGRSRHDHLILCRASISILNIFRLSGDMVHLLSFVVLVLKINATKSCRGRGSDPDLWDRPCGLMHGIVLLSSCMGSSFCPHAWDRPCVLSRVHAGISLKTQELYTLVFVCRYLDLFTNFISPWVLVLWGCGTMDRLHRYVSRHVRCFMQVQHRDEDRLPWWVTHCSPPCESATVPHIPTVPSHHPLPRQAPTFPPPLLQ